MASLKFEGEITLFRSFYLVLKFKHYEKVKHSRHLFSICN